MKIAKDEFQKARKDERKAKRSFLIELEQERNPNLFSILSRDPSKLFQSVRRNSKSSSRIHKLKIGDKMYKDSSPPDGFFDSL